MDDSKHIIVTSNLEMFLESQISSNLFVHRLFSDNNCWCWCWCSQFFNSGHTYGEGALQNKSEQGLYPIHTALASICQIVS